MVMEIKHDHWLVIGPMGSGKSTFASQMSPEYLVLDFDGRWTEQKDNVLGKYHLIGGTDVLEVVQESRRRIPDLKGKVGTVIIDSGTSILDLEQAVGRIKVDRGVAKFNANDNNRNKADIMRALRTVPLSYYCNSMWIFHLEESSMNGKTKMRSTISATELERLKANLNAVMTVVKDSKGRRGMRIEWCRYNDGCSVGQTIWDTEGMWKGVPQRLSVFLRKYHPSCGYNGGAYSLEWLFAFLGSKEKYFVSVEEMCSKLGIVEPPLWFDRKGWGEHVQKAGVE